MITGVKERDRERFIEFDFLNIFILFICCYLKALLFRILLVISHCVPNLSRSATPRRLTRGKFDRAKVCTPNIEIRQTRANDFLDSMISKFLALQSALQRAKRCSRIVRRVVSFTVIECYPRYVNIMRVELHGHAASWKCSFARYNAMCLCNGDCYVTTRAMLNFQTNRLDVCALKLPVILARKSNQND